MRNKILDNPELNSPEGTRLEPDCPPSTDLPETANTIGSTAGIVIRWTSNLIATGLVIAIVTMFGPELVSSIMPSGSANFSDQLDIVEDWPTFQHCNLEFGEVGYQLTRAHFSGGTQEVFDLLEKACREQLEGNVKPFGTLGVQEKKFIEAQVGATPVEMVSGKYRIFCERSEPMLAGYPTAVGIRDDCDSGDSVHLCSRMAVWAMAMPVAENEWTTFVGTAANKDNNDWLDQMIPIDSNKNISLSDKSGGAVIGFSGGDLREAVEFYERFGEENQVELQNIQSTDTSWNASVVIKDENKVVDFRVQLSHPKGKSLTGIIMKKTSDKGPVLGRSHLTSREGIRYE